MGAHRLVGARPMEHTVDSTSAAWRKIQPLYGVNGALPPLGCLPHWGREGVTLAISKTAKKNSRGYLTELKFSGMYEPDLADAGSSLR
jgi:hypothetical protein